MVVCPKLSTYAKVQHISGISKRIPFEGFDFYDLFRVTFENSELGRMNYKLIDDITSELSDKLKIQQQQNILADAWKPYMKELVHSTQMRRAMRARCGIRRTRSFSGNALGSHIG